MSLAGRELYQGQTTHLSAKGTKAIGDKAWRHEERLFPWGVLGEARPNLLVKPSNERSLWGTAEDKRPRRKNSHVSTSITPNPCLVHPLLWQGEREREGGKEGEEGECRAKMVRREAKRQRDEERQREDKSYERGGKKRLREGRRWETKGKIAKGSIKRWASGDSVWNWEWGCKLGRVKGISRSLCQHIRTFLVVSNPIQVRRNQSKQKLLMKC